MRRFAGHSALAAFLTILALPLGVPQASADDRYAAHSNDTFFEPLAEDEGVRSTAPAQPAGRRARGKAAAHAAHAAQAAPGAYFIEFRSRYALSYGHTYAAFGRLDSRGQIVSREVAGLHPAGDSSVPWMLGHFLPVPSETGPSDGDLEDEYISNRYRVTMNEADYAKVVAKIRDMQRSTPLWSATVYNCNSFVGDIARYMGLRSDTSALQTPPNYIASLRRINGGRSVIPANSL